MTTKKMVRNEARQLKAVGIPHVHAFIIAKMVIKGKGPFTICERAKELGYETYYSGNFFLQEEYEAYPSDTWSIKCPRGIYTIG